MLQTLRWKVRITPQDTMAGNGDGEVTPLSRQCSTARMALGAPIFRLFRYRCWLAPGMSSHSPPDALLEISALHIQRKIQTLPGSSSASHHLGDGLLFFLMPGCDVRLRGTEPPTQRLVLPGSLRLIS